MASVAGGFVATVALGAWAQPEPRPAPAEPAAQSAAPGPSPEDPRRMAEAREHFEAASRHYEAREFREAIREFELSNSLVPSADLAYNVARCYEHLDDFGPAKDYYERYLREKIDPPDRSEVEQKIAWLAEQIEARRRAGRQKATRGLLRLSVTPAGAQVSIDGRAVGAAPFAEPLELDPGAHRISIVAPGRQDWVGRVDVRAGDTTHAVAELPAATVHEAVKGGRLWTWVAGGTAAAAALGGVILGVGAQGTMNDAQATYDDGDVATAHSLERDARARADRADYLFGAAIVLGVTGAILFFVEGSAVATETHPAAAEGGGVVARF